MRTESTLEDPKRLRAGHLADLSSVQTKAPGLDSSGTAAAGGHVLLGLIDFEEGGNSSSHEDVDTGTGGKAGIFDAKGALTVPARIEDGIEVRHIAQGCNVPMYRTNIPCVSAGVFSGPLVVSMRPLKPADAIRAVQITSRFPSVHGAPVHLGFPASIGITDINKPDYGDPVPIRADEMPVFWACGVTPQAVIAQVKPAFCITHAPGSMLITDLRNTSLAAL